MLWGILVRSVSSKKPCAGNCGFSTLPCEKIPLVQSKGRKRKQWWCDYCCYRCFEATKWQGVALSHLTAASDNRHGRLCSRDSIDRL